MVIATIKEIKNHENRVALTPAGVKELVKNKHRVLVQTGAGINSGWPDKDYRAAGAVIIPSPLAIIKQADILVKVKEPLPSEYPLLDNFSGKTLFTYLHLAGVDKKLTKKLLDNKITAIGYETVEDKNGGLPLLKPMSQIAGVLAVQYGAEFLQKKHGGIGITLGEIDNASRAEVLIIGGGTVGATAAKTAAGMGANVTLLEINDRRISELKKSFHPYPNLTIVKSSPGISLQAAKKADLLICAVLVTGARAPIVVSLPMIKAMKKGACIIDVAIDQGGSTHVAKATSHTEPIYKYDGKNFCSIPNMPGQAAFQSTQALTNATLPYLLSMARQGIVAALRADKDFAKGLNTYNGHITYRAVATDLKMESKFKEFKA